MFKVNNRDTKTTSFIVDLNNVWWFTPLKGMFKVKNKDIKTVPTGRCTAAVIVILNNIQIFVFGANLFSLYPKYIGFVAYYMKLTHFLPLASFYATPENIRSLVF